MSPSPSPTAVETDAHLMKRVTAGDPRAFEAVHARYHRRAHALARRITGDATGADEATQDAFVALWRDAARFDAQRGSLASWFLTLVRYRSLDWLRRGAGGAAHEDRTPGAADEIEAPERTEEQVLALHERRRLLGLVEALPAKQREIIDLAYVAGYSQSEIAARVGIPLGTVKGRARGGLRRLRFAAQHDQSPVPAGHAG
jgi:RNA polymerase sigma-70 factor (ECF subfamily)